MTVVNDSLIAEELRRFAQLRGKSKTFCLSEVARALAEDWRSLMDRVREVAAREVEAGRLLVLQKGEPVDFATVKGPIRLRQA